MSTLYEFAPSCPMTSLRAGQWWQLSINGVRYTELPSEWTVEEIVELCQHLGATVVELRARNPAFLLKPLY